MDPITAAVLAVLPALAAETLKTGVKDAYEALRAVIRRKWGKEATVDAALTALEKDPASKEKAAELDARLAQVGVSGQAEVLEALQALVARMNEAGMKEAAATIQVNVSAGGTAQGVIGAGTVKIDTMNFGGPPPSPR